MSSVGSSRCFRQAPLPPEFLDNEELICALISSRRIADEQLSVAGFLGRLWAYLEEGRFTRRRFRPRAGLPPECDPFGLSRGVRRLATLYGMRSASDLVRRLPFCEPIPPLTDRRNPRSEQRHIKTQRCT